MLLPCRPLGGGGLKAGCTWLSGQAVPVCVTMSVHLNRSRTSTPSLVVDLNQDPELVLLWGHIDLVQVQF